MSTIALVSLVAGLLLGGLTSSKEEKKMKPDATERLAEAIADYIREVRVVR